MIETAHIRLSRAAEMLGTDTDTLLIAAAEGRVSLWALANQYRKAVKYQDDLDENFDPIRYPLETKTLWLLFVPLTRKHAAGLLTEGETGSITSLSPPDPKGNCWEDEDMWDMENPTTLTLPLDRVFLQRADVEAIRSQGKVPELGSIAEPPAPPDRSYVSDELAYLLQAARKFWGQNVAKRDPSTHPSNATVAAWLIEHGLSKSQAEKGASIIRPEWAHNGRKPDA